MSTDTADRRQVLCDWLRANGVNADQVPLDSDMTIEADANGQRWLRCEVYVVDAKGGRVLDIGGASAARTRIMTPLQTDPPHWWEPREKPTRDQLLDAVGQVLRLHRAAEHQGKTICVECSAYDGWTTTGNPPVSHPCDTVKALGSTATR